jgi:hypothetical protein
MARLTEITIVARLLSEMHLCKYYTRCLSSSDLCDYDVLAIANFIKIGTDDKIISTVPADALHDLLSEKITQIYKCICCIDPTLVPKSWKLAIKRQYVTVRDTDPNPFIEYEKQM